MTREYKIMLPFDRNPYTAPHMSHTAPVGSMMSNECIIWIIHISMSWLLLERKQCYQNTTNDNTQQRQHLVEYHYPQNQSDPSLFWTPTSDEWGWWHRLTTERYRLMIGCSHFDQYNTNKTGER